MSAAADGVAEGPFRDDPRRERTAKLLWSKGAGTSRLSFVLYSVAIGGVTLISMLALGDADALVFTFALVFGLFWPVFASLAQPVPRSGGSCVMGPGGIRCEQTHRTLEWSFDWVREVSAADGCVVVQLADGEAIALASAVPDELALWIRARSPELARFRRHRVQLVFAALYLPLCPAVVAVATWLIRS